VVGIGWPAPPVERAALQVFDGDDDAADRLAGPATVGPVERHHLDGTATAWAGHCFLLDLAS